MDNLSIVSLSHQEDLIFRAICEEQTHYIATEETRKSPRSTPGTGDENGWFPVDIRTIHNKTGLTADKQRPILASLVDKELIEVAVCQEQLLFHVNAS